MRTKRLWLFVAGWLTAQPTGPGIRPIVVDLGTLGGETSSAQALPTLGGDLILAGAINDAGQVAGYSSVASGERHTFLWDNSVMTDLGTLDRTISSATAINEAGEVAGVSETAGGAAHAFLWKNGVMTDLGTLNGANSTAAAINDAGDVIGAAVTGGGKAHAVLWLRAGKGHRAFLASIVR